MDNCILTLNILQRVLYFLNKRRVSISASNHFRKFSWPYMFTSPAICASSCSQGDFAKYLWSRTRQNDTIRTGFISGNVVCEQIASAVLTGYRKFRIHYRFGADINSLFSPFSLEKENPNTSYHISNVIDLRDVVMEGLVLYFSCKLSMRLENMQT